MSDRIAYFGKEIELIEGFELDHASEVSFEAHYNLVRGTKVPVIKFNKGRFNIERMQWGKQSGNNNYSTENAGEEDIKRFENKSIERVVMPISGFYIWKDKAIKDHPFFVRKIDNTFLYAAAFSFKDETDQTVYADYMLGESNTLIQPITEKMPIVLKQNRAKEWLRDEISAEEIFKTAGSEFFITELTVHRVTKKVKDSLKNDESLIQPIPK